MSKGKKSGNRVRLRENAPNRMDGRAFLDALDSASVATAFFDPQYRGVLDKLSFGNEGARQTGRAELPQMEEPVIREFILEIDRVLRPSGHLFLWIDKFHLCEGVGTWLQGTAFSLVDMITWNKGRIGMGYRSRRKSEYLLVLQKRPVRAKGIWHRHDIPDCWDERADTKAHAHSKPVGLQTALIEATTRPGDIVIDPAAGSYSVLTATRNVADRIFMGSDLDLPETYRQRRAAAKRAAAPATRRLLGNKPIPPVTAQGPAIAASIPAQPHP